MTREVLNRPNQGGVTMKSVLALADRHTAIVRVRVFDVVKSLRGVGPVGARRGSGSTG